jgi:hypothetical protein
MWNLIAGGSNLHSHRCKNINILVEHSVLQMERAESRKPQYDLATICSLHAFCVWKQETERERDKKTKEGMRIYCGRFDVHMMTMNITVFWAVILCRSERAQCLSKTSASLKYMALQPRRPYSSGFSNVLCYSMELTSIEASFYECPNTVNTVLKVVWCDVSNIPDEER